MIEKEYNIIEAAKILGIKARTVREWIKKGKIKAQKPRNKWLISGDELQRVMAMAEKSI